MSAEKIINALRKIADGFNPVVGARVTGKLLNQPPPREGTVANLTQINTDPRELNNTNNTSPRNQEYQYSWWEQEPFISPLWKTTLGFDVGVGVGVPLAKRWLKSRIGGYKQDIPNQLATILTDLNSGNPDTIANSLKQQGIGQKDAREIAAKATEQKNYRDAVKRIEEAKAGRTQLSDSLIAQRKALQNAQTKANTIVDKKSKEYKAAQKTIADAQKKLKALKAKAGRSNVDTLSTLKAAYNEIGATGNPWRPKLPPEPSPSPTQQKMIADKTGFAYKNGEFIVDPAPRAQKIRQNRSGKLVNTNPIADIFRFWKAHPKSALAGAGINVALLAGPLGANWLHKKYISEFLKNNPDRDVKNPLAGTTD